MRILVALLLAGLALGGYQAEHPAKSGADVTSSAEMQRIFAEDQAARAPDSKIDGKVIYREDAARRERVKKLLDEGALHSGQDFEEAATVFQHGATADDYLLAHTLASVAVAKGRDSAIWIMAATMDRYLSKIGQPQIYGTQFHREQDGTWTQEPYDRALVSDALRKELQVPSQKEQQSQLQRMNP